jgi:hypothetical protein
MIDPFMSTLDREFENKALDPRTVPPQPFPYQISKFSETLIKDADGISVLLMANSNQQGIVTRDLILDTLNFFTEAEALAETNVAVDKALRQLRDAVEDARLQGAA